MSKDYIENGYKALEELLEYQKMNKSDYLLVKACYYRLMELEFSPEEEESKDFSQESAEYNK